MATQIQLRRGTSVAWTVANPILSQGEQGYELDTHYSKIGDGINNWNNLPYLSASYSPSIPSSFSISSSWASASLSSSTAITASFALNGGGSGTTLTTGSTYPITSSWSEKTTVADAISFVPLTSTSASWASSSISSSYALNAGTGGTTLTTGSTYLITASWSNNTLQSTSASWASQSAFAPVIFSNVQIVDGKLLILSDIGTWFALTAIDDGSGSFTTVLTETTNTGSYYASASIYYVTSSQHIVSSSFASSSISSSYAITASFALNGGGSGTTLTTGSTYSITASWSNTSSYVTPYSFYATITTGSSNGITCSFNQPNQQVNLTTALAYSFTSANLPQTGQSADVVLYISHSSAATSSLSFPTTWINIDAGWPTSINANTLGTLWLRAIGTDTIIGSLHTSGNSTASYAISSSYALNAGTGGTTLTTGSTYLITASWSNNTISTSYAISSSYALNGDGTTLTSASWASSSLSASYISPYSNNNILTTGSSNGITCSFDQPNNQINLTAAQLYSFTASNIPVAGKTSDIILYISHSAASTSSLLFPSSWQNIDNGWPTSISGITLGTLWLRAIGTDVIIGSLHTSGNATTVNTTNEVPTGTPDKGTMIYHTGSNVMYIFNGISWKSSSFA